MSQTRLLAVQLLHQVIHNKLSLTEVLKQPTPSADVSTPLLHELCYGVLRFHPQLNFLTTQLLEKPLPAKHIDLQILLWVGLYQLLHLAIPEHAVINETVATCVALRKPWARGLLNAVLRRCQRERSACLARCATQESAHYAHPTWLLEAIKHDWPDAWQAILHANNQRPPLTLRVNRLRVNAEEYVQRLQQQGITAQPITEVPSALTLQHAVDVTQLPGFACGDVSVQDASGQFAATLLDIQPEQRVLDACAAPGSKTCHILECAPDCTLLAVEKSAARLTRLSENLQRLQLHATLCCADATQTAQWWDGQAFARILLDAPCSATGVIRRHPDIKWLRQADDIATLHEQQYTLLQALWPCLAPHGLLLYATCSVLRVENDEVITRFLSVQRDAKVMPLQLSCARNTRHGIQILPGTQQMDGFYYALLCKTAPE